MSAPVAPGAFERAMTLIGALNYMWTNTESLLVHVIAGLARTDKETALIVFLTLNTTRARLDLVERLAKLDRVSANERAAVLETTRRLQTMAGLRNHYNHCIYAFDPATGNARTILMRIADRRDRLKIGKTSELDSEAVAGLEASLGDLTTLNRDLWTMIRCFDYPA